MIAAAFETSARPGSVALWTGTRLLQHELEDARKHASDILPALERLLVDAGLTARDLEAVCVGIGPGSYTGLRVGVATALGLSCSTGAVLRGVPSFEALALDATQPGEDLCVALDARAGGWYFARYTRTNGDVSIDQRPCVLEGAELVERLRSSKKACIDDSVASLLEAHGVDAERFSTTARPRAASVVRLGMQALEREGPHRPEDCEPLYLRSFVVKQRARS